MKRIALGALLLTVTTAHAGMRSDAPHGPWWLVWHGTSGFTMGLPVGDLAFRDGDGHAAKCTLLEMPSQGGLVELSDLAHDFPARPDGWCYVADAPR